MSGITTIRAAMQTLIAGVLPDYKVVPNPYEPDQNSQLALAKGFGIGIGPGEPARPEICGKYGMQRQFNVLLVNLCTNQVNDPVAFRAIETGLLEAFHLVRKKFETEVTLGNVCIKNDYVGDSGLTFLSGDAFKYISCSADFVVLYREDL